MYLILLNNDYKYKTNLLIIQLLDFLKILNCNPLRKQYRLKSYQNNN